MSKFEAGKAQYLSFRELGSPRAEAFFTIMQGVRRHERTTESLQVQQVLPNLIAMFDAKMNAISSTLFVPNRPVNARETQPLAGVVFREVHQLPKSEMKPQMHYGVGTTEERNADVERQYQQELRLPNRELTLQKGDTQIIITVPGETSEEKVPHIHVLDKDKIVVAKDTRAALKWARKLLG